ncbi:hypothetical protein HED22_03290 [Thalassospira sp. HF15]|uniref:hypothetical protein n=1 Tax=Thalassospira sp. HF15 TaxID=2722755 RepID=UPI001431822B|nr:hypothetical protein [Thalassospira sp. HF15]NIY74658.1 hypothetical protein [Thalassospira sp. HF15]
MIAEIARYLGVSALHAIRFLPSLIILAHFTWGLAGAHALEGTILVVSVVSIAFICISFLTFWLFDISPFLFVVADLASMWGLGMFVTKVMMSSSLSLYYFNVFAYWVLLYLFGLGVMLAMRKFLGFSKAV